MNLLAYLIAGVALVGALMGAVWWADANIETTAGVRRGQAETKAQWDAANEAARKREAEASAKAAADLAAERKKRRVVIKERTVYVDREIEKLVDSGRCFTPGGVQCVNAAINGESACRPGPDGAMPAARPAD